MSAVLHLVVMVKVQIRGQHYAKWICVSSENFWTNKVLLVLNIRGAPIEPPAHHYWIILIRRCSQERKKG